MNQDLGKRSKVPRWLLPALGYTLSAASLIWVYKGTNLQLILADFLSLDWRYMSIAVLFELSVYLSQAWRWNLLLRPVVRASFWRSVQSIFIGLYASGILPLRPGELIRCYLAAHWNEIPMSQSVASVTLERILDGIWLVLALLVMTQGIAVDSSLVTATRWLAGGLLVAIGLLVLIAFNKEKVHSLYPKTRGARWLLHAVEGLEIMGNGKNLVTAAGASFVYFALQVLPVWAVTQGYDLDLSIWAAATVSIILRLGTVIPNAPGNLGVFQFSCVVGLKLFNVPEVTARGFSTVMFSVATLPLLIGGFVSVALSGLKLGDIHSRARASVRPTAGVSKD